MQRGPSAGVASELRRQWLSIQGVKGFSDLAALNQDLLQAMISFEEATVLENECRNALIEGITGGHHRDLLDILLGAIEGLNWERARRLTLYEGCEDFPAQKALAGFLFRVKDAETALEPR